MKIDIKKNIVFFSWLICVLSVLVAIFAVPLVVGAAYHPNAPYAPYAQAAAIGSLVFVLCSASLAVRISILRNTGDRTRLMNELGYLLLAAIASAVVIRIAIPQVPSSFVQHVGNIPYRIPSEYTSNRNKEPGERAAVSIVYCQNNWIGYYESIFRECKRASVTLSARPVTSKFDAYYYLDRELKVPRNGDHITDKTQLTSEMKVIKGDGWTGYTTSKGRRTQFPRARHIVLDPEDRIILFGNCVSSYPVCSIYSQSSRGLLSFKYVEGQQFQYEAWKEQERRILTMLDSWQASQ